MAVLDAAQRLFIVVIEKPAGATDWEECVERAHQKMVAAREEGLASGAFSQGDLDHRRGAFLAINAGVSFGGGAMVRLFGPFWIIT